ncbi:acyl-ACP desaturase [Embleya sp. NBC_00888]|uniref:acyl-ACP desaturase n=1 Tax=Embleya sp. NBC_00888 TaxID=2975960 RepID=UPI0038654D85|nr:acyl-ACP desaturase [Embleya sp. NBC_00888]
MIVEHESRIGQLFDSYVRSWGPICWRDQCAKIQAPINCEYGTMLYALGLIETDSVVMRRKLAATRADRSNPIKQFNILWLAEEAEHGRALEAAAEKLGVRSLTFSSRRSIRDLRSIATWPALYLSGFLVPHLDAAYCTLGSVQEYIALTTYRRIGEKLGDPALDGLLRQIAQQEGRHMKFYRGAAQVLLEPRQARRVTAALLARLWRPPGVDLFGLPKWLEIFRPILEDDVYVGRLLRADDLLADLIGDSIARPMKRFLETNQTLLL